jgi:2,4-dienoyl-CoA reductase-like NADH-dependent reductase (Old Yellow Enzyme family)
MRFPLELFAAVRAGWPADKPLGMRLNGTDWDDAGLSNEDAIAFARALKDLGCDFFDVTGGGNSMVRPPLKPGYQAPFAQTIKQATGVPTMAVGMIRDPQIAEDLITSGQCDMVAIARGFLYEPRWTWRAAHELGAEGQYPPQYARANPKLWPQAFSDADDDPNITWEPGAAPHIMVPKRS